MSNEGGPDDPTVPPKPTAEVVNFELIRMLEMAKRVGKDMGNLDSDVPLFTQDAFDRINDGDYATAREILDEIPYSELDESLVETYREKYSPDSYGQVELAEALKAYRLTPDKGLYQKEELYALAETAAKEFAPKPPAKQEAVPVPPELDESVFGRGRYVTFNESAIHPDYVDSIREELGIKSGETYCIYGLQLRLNNQWVAHIGPDASPDVLKGFNPNIPKQTEGPYKDVVPVPVAYLQPDNKVVPFGPKG